MSSTGENEANVRFLLDNYPSMQLEAQTPHLGGPGLCGPNWLTAEESCLVQRFDPAGPLDTIGATQCYAFHPPSPLNFRLNM